VCGDFLLSAVDECRQLFARVITTDAACRGFDPVADGTVLFCCVLPYFRCFGCMCLALAALKSVCVLQLADLKCAAFFAQIAFLLDLIIKIDVVTVPLPLRPWHAHRSFAVLTFSHNFCLSKAVCQKAMCSPQFLLSLLLQMSLIKVALSHFSCSTT